MSAEPHRTRSELAPRFLLGVATGLLLGLLTSLSPVIAVVAMVAVLVAAVIGIFGVPIRRASSNWPGR